MPAMIDLQRRNGPLLGSITEADLKVLQDAQEDSTEDQDYIDPTIDVIGDAARRNIC
jgi:hypothetical protein